MEITFLGTGTSQGVPVISCNCAICLSDDPKDTRLRSSVLIETDTGNTIVIDTGPDFRAQMLREKVKKLDAILITHPHKDHIAGLDDVRAFNYFMKKPMEVFADAQTIHFLQRDFFYAFQEEKYPGVPDIHLNTITEESFKIKNDRIIPIRVMHYKLPVLGFRIEDFTYITDANFISSEEKEKIKGSKVIVINALRRRQHISHFTFEQAIEILEELKPERAYLTHISHQLGLYDEVEKELPDYIHLAYDGLTVKC